MTAAPSRARVDARVTSSASSSTFCGGTAVFDWSIPREWNIRDAYIKNERGEKIIDFAQSNLHVMS